MIGRLAMTLMTLMLPSIASAGGPEVLTSASPEQILRQLLPKSDTAGTDDAELTRGLFIQPKSAVPSAVPSKALPVSQGVAFQGSANTATETVAKAQDAVATNTYGDKIAATVNLAVTFKLASADLTPDARTLLDSAGAALSDPGLSAYRFLIGGHTDATGTAAANLTLSARRAAATVSYLEEKWHIDAARLVTRAFGESALLFPDEPNDGRNRRVEISTLQ